MLKITLTAGMAGRTQTQIRTIRGLGLGKFSSVVFHADSPTINGMLKKVAHLVTVVKEERVGAGANQTRMEKAAGIRKDAADKVLAAKKSEKASTK